MKRFLLTIILISCLPALTSFGMEAENDTPKIKITSSQERIQRNKKKLHLDFTKLRPEANNSSSCPGTPTGSPHCSPQISPRSPHTSLSESTGSLDFFSGSPRPKDVNHVAVILDGNRRWAKEQNLPPEKGHEEGLINTAPRITQELYNFDINTVTLWFFSTENWQRSEKEVRNLMNLFEKYLEIIEPYAVKSEIRVVHLGWKEDPRLPKSLVNKLYDIEKKTSSFCERTLNIAINYQGQDEIIRAIKRMKDAGVDFTNLDRNTFAKYLDTGDQKYPNPDLIIRTSKVDKKLSGFMAWQSANSIFYFTHTYAPDLKTENFLKAFKAFEQRPRQ